jgi:hypothetical protein
MMDSGTKNENDEGFDSSNRWVKYLERNTSAYIFLGIFFGSGNDND